MKDSDLAEKGKKACVLNTADTLVLNRRRTRTARSSLTGRRQRNCQAHRRRGPGLVSDLPRAGGIGGNRCSAKKSTNALTLGARYRLRRPQGPTEARVGLLFPRTTREDASADSL